MAVDKGGKNNGWYNYNKKDADTVCHVWNKILRAHAGKSVSSRIGDWELIPDLVLSFFFKLI